MELQTFTGSEFLSQFLFSLSLILLLLLASRALVARTNYSSVLILVVSALGMGVLLTRSGITSVGIPELPLLSLLSRGTLIALIPIFFVGGQQLRKIFGEIPHVPEEINLPSKVEVFYGTTTSQLTMISRAFFLLLGITGTEEFLIGYPANDPLGQFYPLIGYISLMTALVMVDSKAIIHNRRAYVQRGIIEFVLILAIIIAANSLAFWQGNTIALPEILFIVMISTSLGSVMHSWQSGVTFQALFYAGLPVALAANFVIGGSWLEEGFMMIEQFTPTLLAVLIYGFLGQFFWLFGALALMIYVGRNREVRNLATGLSGSLAHINLLAAATANEMGAIAIKRAPIMTIITIFSYLLVTIVDRISLGSPTRIIVISAIIIFLGALITIKSLQILKQSESLESDEVRAMMLFSFGWQVIALFSGILLLHAVVIQTDYGLLTYSANLSHIGLFALFQEHWLSGEIKKTVPFIYAMPLIAQPFLFWVFGYAINRGETLTIGGCRAVLALALFGLIAIAVSGTLIIL